MIDRGNLFRRAGRSRGRILIFSGVFLGVVILSILVILVVLPIFSEEKKVENSSLEGQKETNIEEENREDKEKEKVDEKGEVATDLDVSRLTNSYGSANCTTALGPLMLINPNFQVETSFITKRKSELIDLTETYGIIEGLPSGNGRPLMDREAAAHLNDMLNDYKAEYAGHSMTTRSCFRERGTSCGRLCVATGGSDHHSGYTCDLVDDAYGDTLDTDLLSKHPEWQWLHQNSYKYGFIDRFIEAKAGGSMSEPANVNSEGTTGLYEIWHYRYVGVEVAREIKEGKYNNGEYDSLEHYLKATGRVRNLVSMGESCREDNL